MQGLHSDSRPRPLKTGTSPLVSALSRLTRLMESSSKLCVTIAADWAMRGASARPLVVFTHSKWHWTHWGRPETEKREIEGRRTNTGPCRSGRGFVTSRNQPRRFQAKGRNNGAARCAVETPKHEPEKCKDVSKTTAETVAMPLAIDSFLDDEYTPVNYVNTTSAIYCSARKPLWRMALDPFSGGVIIFPS